MSLPYPNEGMKKRSKYIYINIYNLYVYNNNSEKSARALGTVLVSMAHAATPMEIDGAWAALQTEAVSGSQRQQQHNTTLKVSQTNSQEKKRTM